MKKKKRSIFTLLFMLMLGLGLGYAILTQDLTINGITKVKGNNWDIHFERLVVNPDSVILADDDVGATIDANDNTLVNYTVTLNSPGDFYEFTVDVVNAGTVDGMIGTIISKLNGNTLSLTNPLPNYLDYTVAYSNGVEIASNQMLVAGDTETFKVRVEFRRDIDNYLLPAADQTNTFSFGISYIQADDHAFARPSSVFESHSWETIISNVENGNIDDYHVGDTKAVTLGNSLGTHTLRIANMSTPDECLTTGFSQTACGFVLEFVDIITTHNMNPVGEYKGVQYEHGWNVDGWPDSSMRAFINDTNEPTSIINSLPNVLKNAILDTTVVSSHGPTEGESNFISVDKLYLLSTKELWGKDSSGGNEIFADTAEVETRQLDYYKKIGVNVNHYSLATKQYNGVNSFWWLRTAHKNFVDSFFCVADYGVRYVGSASYERGVSPAFRIG